MDKSFKAIDMHTHINHGVPGDSLGECYEIYRADLDYLMRSTAMRGAELTEYCLARIPTP